MRKTLLVLIGAALVACRDSSAPEPFDVTGQWGFEGAVAGLSSCGFYASATLVGTSQEYTGTATLELTTPNSPVTVEVRGDEHSTTVGTLELSIRARHRGTISGTYTCQNASGQWSMVRYP